jgi:hypothetical protein
LVIGAALAFAMTMAGGPPAAVTAESGDLTAQELNALRIRRKAANDFVGQVLLATRDEQSLNTLAQQYQFGFGFDGSVVSDRDVVTTELLRREAERLGLDVTIDGVYAYIKQISDGKLSSGKFKEIRTQLNLSESELHEILQAELQARLAAEYLYDYEFDDLFRYSPTLTPQEYWEFYQRMYVTQQAEVAAVPVSAFVDESQEPTPAELQEFFEEYRHNFPNVTAKGQLEEGRPGFQQPRRVELAYFEAVFDDYRDGIEPATEEEIQQRYQEDYVQPAEEAAARAAEQSRSQPAGGPALPGRPAGADEESDPASPTSDEPADDATDSTPETPASETTPESDPADPDPNATEDETPADETPAEGSPGETEAESTPPESSDAPTEPDSADEATPPSSSAIPDETSLQQVLFLNQNEAEPAADAASADESAEEPASEAADPPATPDESDPADPPADAPADPEPASEGDPAAEPDADAETPAEADSSEPMPDAVTETPAEGAPASDTEPSVPSSSVPLLDEALRTQIQIDIENDRVAERLRRVAADAANFVEEMGLGLNVPEDDPLHVTREEAAKRFQAYAEEHGLHYAQTPLLSAQELNESEDHPVGQAVTVSDGQNAQAIPNIVFQTGAQDTYRPITARNPTTDSWFVTWKTGDQAPYVPDDLDNERVREQVVQAWREVQAREKAQARADELAKQVSESGKPMGEVLGDQTVTGKEGELNLTLAETGQFRWLSIPGAPQPNPFSFYPPEIQDPPGVEKAGPDFMETVFNEIGEGETGVAANFDRSTFYVVHVTQRTPARDEAAFEDFKQRFLAEPVFEQNDFLAQFGLDPRSVYQRLAVQTMIEYQSDWVDELWKRHNATLFEPQEG